MFVLLTSPLTLLASPRGLSKQISHADLIRLLTTNICRSCNLSHADLAYSSLDSADLTGSKFTKAILINSTLANANLSNADLSNVNLTGSDLQGANFTGAILEGVNFNNANLTGAIISREQLLQSHWHRAFGVDTSILLDSDLLELVVIHLRENELAAAKQYLSSILTRSSDNASIFVLRASINFKSGEINSAVNDLKLAINIFESNGDFDSAMAVEEVLTSYKNSFEMLPPKAYGSGYGIEMLNAVKSIVPILLPLTSKFLLPFSLL